MSKSNPKNPFGDREIESYYNGEKTPLDFTSVEFKPAQVATALVRHAYALGIDEGIARVNGKTRGGVCGGTGDCPIRGESASIDDIIDQLDGTLVLMLSHMASRLNYLEMVTERARAELERAAS